jgi:hypothetical protein
LIAAIHISPERRGWLVQPQSANVLRVSQSDVHRFYPAADRLPTWQRSKDLSLERTQPPTEVPGYDCSSSWAAGAYGEVWVGVDRNTGRKVAIKFYAHRRGVDWSLLSREVEKLVFLSADRYVVQLLDVGWDADPPYYVMEYVENGSLDDLLRNHGTFTCPRRSKCFARSPSAWPTPTARGCCTAI